MPTSTGTERRERAAAAIREAKAQERRRRVAFIGALTLVVAVLGALLFVGLRDAGNEAEKRASGDLQAVSGLGASSQLPWSLPSDTPRRVKMAGMNLGQMGTAEHYHAHLDIIIDGKSVGLLPNIGVDRRSGSMSGVHTHESDGIVHVEAPVKDQPYALGQLFTEWDVKLTADQVGAYKADGAKVLRVYVNGKNVSGNPALIRLANRQQITVVFGDPSADGDIPDSFDFKGAGL